jgi:hypothetical protein
MNSFTPFIAPNPPRRPLVTATSRKSFHVPVGFSSSYPIRCTLLFLSTPLRPRHARSVVINLSRTLLAPWRCFGHGIPTVIPFAINQMPSEFSPFNITSSAYRRGTSSSKSDLAPGRNSTQIVGWVVGINSSSTAMCITTVP